MVYKVKRFLVNVWGFLEQKGKTINGLGKYLTCFIECFHCVELALLPFIKKPFLHKFSPEYHHQSINV